MIKKFVQKANVIDYTRSRKSDEWRRRSHGVISKSKGLVVAAQPGRVNPSCRSSSPSRTTNCGKDNRYSAACSSTQTTIPLDRVGGKILSSSESHVISSTGDTASRLDKTFPRICWSIGFGHRKCPDADHGTEMVPTGILREPKTLKSRTELLHNGKRGLGYGI